MILVLKEKAKHITELFPRLHQATLVSVGIRNTRIIQNFLQTQQERFRIMEGLL